MSELKQIMIGILIVLAVFDVVITASRSSLLHTNLVRILSQRELSNKSIRRTLALIQPAAPLKASLHITQLLLRFFIAPFVLTVYAHQGWSGNFGWQEIGVLLLAALALFLLEEIVDIIVLRQPERWAVGLTPFARLLVVLFTPIVALPLALKHSNGADIDTPNAVTEDELKSLVDAGHQDGILEQDEREMIYSIFRFGDTLAREVMVPRIYVTAMDVDLSLETAMNALINSGYSRVPVYTETIDNIQGVLYAKDLLRAWRNGSPVQSLRELLREPYFVPEAKKVDELLDEMQARRVHMAIVVDEYGGVAGLVTLEDLVEEIVGEIRDEFDQTEELPYQKVNENEYLCLGRITLDDFNELMGTTLPSDEAETLGGFIYDQIERVPVTGEQLSVNGLLLTVEQVSGRRIRKVRAVKVQPDAYEGQVGQDESDDDE